MQENFVDLEKAFDMVPREVISWAMHKLGVEWLVSAVMSMYTGAKTVVRTVYGNSTGKSGYTPRFSHGNCCMQSHSFVAAA